MVPTFLLYKKIPSTAGGSKSFRYALSQPNGKPPSDEGAGFAVGEDGGRQTRREHSLQQAFASQKSAPSSEGACANHRHTRPVVMIGYGFLSSLE